MIPALVEAAGALAALVLLALATQHLLLARRAEPDAAPLEAAEPPQPDPADAPKLLVQVPVYNEPASVAGALAAAAALDWPRDRLTIQLLDDSTDDTGTVAGAAIAALAEKGIAIEHLIRSGRDGFKAGALAAGLARSDAAFVAVLDADFRPPRDWLRRAVAALEQDPGAAFVQFRFEFANREQNWMTRVQQLTVDAHFLLEQPGRLALGGPIQFNGTAGMWRRAAIADAGGWSADTLAEDLDLAIRAFARGWRARLVLAPPVLCEAPADAASWRVQQQRWSKGFVQVAVKSLPRIWTAGWPLPARLAATQLVCLQAAFPCLVVAAVAFCLDGTIRGFGAGHAAILLAAAALTVFFAVLLTWPAHRRLRGGGVFRYAVVLASLPPLFAYLAAANSAAIVAAAFRGRQDFVRTPKSGS